MGAAPSRRPRRAPASRPAEPACRLLRPSALLLAALLIGVAALLAPTPRAAQAQSDTVWSATLTVQTAGENREGCSLYPASNTANKCSNRNVLTDDSFTVDGTDYRIDIFSQSSASDQHLKLTLDNPISDSLKALTLQVDGENFLLLDATIDTDAVQNDTASWYNTGLSWSVGDRVSVKLIRLHDDWRSWSPTLTVKDVVQNNSVGCGTTANPCSTALTDDAFVYGGVEYTLRGIALGGGIVTWTFYKNIPSGLQPFQIRVGSTELHGGTVSGKIATNVASTLNWSVGDRVRLRLIGAPPAAPTALTFSPGPRTDTIAAAWTAPDDSLTARITGYEVRYKALHARNAAASVAGDPTTGWVTTQVGTTPRATLDASYALRRQYHGTVRALSAAGVSPWSTQAQGSPKAPPGGPAATPLNLLSASATSVSEGGTVTITARLARNAESDAYINLSTAGSTAQGTDYSLSTSTITIPAGQRSGTATLTITDDSAVEGAESIVITPDFGNVHATRAALPRSGVLAYQLASLRIDIAASDQPTPTSSESASPPPHHSDPYLAELQERIIRCAASIKTTVDQYVAGTATAEQVRAARAASAACQ